MEGDRLPSASAVQELVTAWKLLWGWRKRRPEERGCTREVCCMTEEEKRKGEQDDEWSYQPHDD